MEKKFTFDSSFDIEQNGFEWMTPPKKYTFTPEGLSIYMDGKKDFWRVTYTKPHIIKSDGHVLFKSFPYDKNVMIETSFKLTAVNELDQAGIILFYDPYHWIKTGLDYVEGKFRLSSVVTNKFSDWSTQDHLVGNLSLRLYKLGEDVVVEWKKNSTEWSVLRICRANVDELTSDFKLGIYACSPTEESGSVCYKYAEYKTFDDYEHAR